MKTRGFAISEIFSRFSHYFRGILPFCSFSAFEVKVDLQGHSRKGPGRNQELSLNERKRWETCSFALSIDSPKGPFHTKNSTALESAVFSRLSFPATEAPDPRRVSEGASEGFLKGPRTCQLKDPSKTLQKRLQKPLLKPFWGPGASVAGNESLDSILLPP